MRRLARVETITTGSEWKEPLDTGEPTAIWVGETTARPATATPSRDSVSPFLLNANSAGRRKTRIKGIGVTYVRHEENKNKACDICH
jgi:predicted phage gp36 major capsid-like protein